MSKSIVAIGDIHGCVQSLKALWKKLEPYKDHTHVFIGDYIDRGPDSKGVVDFLLEVQDERESVFLKGNHELMLLNSLSTVNKKHWILNGGQTTLDSYNIEYAHGLPDNHLEFYLGLKLYYETDDYFFVHAGHQRVKLLKRVNLTKKWKITFCGDVNILMLLRLRGKKQ